MKKNAQLNINRAISIISFTILALFLLLTGGGLLPALSNAGDNISAASGGSGIGSLFSSSTGILVLLVVAGILFVLVKGFLNNK